MTPSLMKARQIHGVDSSGNSIPIKVGADGTLPVTASVSVGTTTTTTTNISFASASEQTIIAAPSAGNRIKISKLVLLCTSNFTMLLKSGSTTMMTIFGSMADLDFNPPLALGDGEAFKLDSDIATQTYGGVCYYTEAV